MRGACGVNAVPAVGEFHGKDSVSSPSGEQNLQLAEHQIPILAPGAPMLLDALGGKIEHSAQGIVIGKAGLVLGDLPELAVEPLNDVRRVYDFPNLGRVFIKRAQNIPVIFPAFDAGWVLPAPLFSKL